LEAPTACAPCSRCCSGCTSCCSCCLAAPEELYIYTHIRMYMYVCTYVRMYIHTYISMYMHTYIGGGKERVCSRHLIFVLCVRGAAGAIYVSASCATICVYEDTYIVYNSYYICVLILIFVLRVRMPQILFFRLFPPHPLYFVSCCTRRRRRRRRTGESGDRCLGACGLGIYVYTHVEYVLSVSFYFVPPPFYFPGRYWRWQVIETGVMLLL